MAQFLLRLLSRRGHEQRPAHDPRASRRDPRRGEEAGAGLRRYAERLKTLHDIDRAILAAQSLEAITLAAMTRVRNLVPCDRASLVLLDRATREVRVAATNGREGLGPAAGTVMPLADFDGFTDPANPRTRYYDDLTRPGSRPPIIRRLRDLGVRSLVATPLLVEGDVIGKLNLCSTRPFAFASEYREIAREVADTLAVAIQETRLRERATEAEILRRTDEMRTALLNSVSHNLRTPLSAIKAAAGSLLQDVEWDAPSRRELAGIIDRGVDRLDRLVANILDLSRIESGAFEPDKKPYPIGELALAVARNIGALAARHRVVIDVPDGLPPVPFDYMQVDQVLSNLLENALRYTPVQTEIRISARLEGAEVRVSVCDQGPGIPSGERMRIFEKFYRLERNRSTKGTGLGLFVARAFVEAHGGRIWAEETTSAGACFVFTLPLGCDERPAGPWEQPLGDGSPAS